MSSLLLAVVAAIGASTCSVVVVVTVVCVHVSCSVSGSGGGARLLDASIVYDD